MAKHLFENPSAYTFQAICTHFEHYPAFINDGGTYDIPRDQYEKLIDIYNRGETARSSLMRSEETLFKAMKAWEVDNSVEIKSVIKPAVVGYDEVQLEVADKTIAKEETQIKETDKEIRQDAVDASKPTFAEGAKATALTAVLEGSITFAIKIYQKKKAGIKLQNFTEEDWKEVGLDTFIGIGKGAIRGAVIYTMTNYTPVPSPLANSMVTATFGVTAQARKLSKGDITQAINARRTWSTTITKVAITTNCTMIRIRDGTPLRNNDMIRLENAHTNVTERPITKAGSNFTVTANAEQIPKI